MDIVFMGTPLFSVASLEKLINSKKHKVLAIFTKPDKINKRGKKVEFSEVKKIAIKYNIPVYQPERLKDLDVYEYLKSLKPEVIVVVAYGKILPVEILELPKYGCINVHGSILPKYRGAAPIQRAIINGEIETGITTMYMDKGMDTGDMLLTNKIKITSEDTAKSMFEKLSKVGADLLLKTLDEILNGTIKRIKQDDDKATYAIPLTKEEARINWEKSTAEEIVNLIRGMDAGPVAYSFLGEKRIKLFKARNISYGKVFESPGTVLSENPLIVACKDGTTLEILELQAENKRKMSAKEFVLGNKIIGKILK